MAEGIEGRITGEEPYADTVDIRTARRERACCATWLWYLGRDGLASEGQHGPLHEAIRANGHDEGREFYQGVTTPREFAERFLEGSSYSILKLRTLRLDDDVFEVEFNECPLVARWKELGATPEQQVQLCDIAMDEDRGVVDEIPALRYELRETIAGGSHHCIVRVSRAGYEGR